MKRNPENERTPAPIPWRLLKGHVQLDDQSVDAIAAALDRFDERNNRRDFRAFRPEQADVPTRLVENT